MARAPSAHPRTVVGRCLNRIAARDAAIGAFVHIDRDGALQAAEASARRWAAGAPLSPIDGMPIAIKANIAVAGWPWHAGVEAYADRRAEAEADAVGVARLRAAGAVPIGLTNMDEGGLGATTDNRWSGRTHNPHRQGFTAGGSSGGSAAAVAAGFCTAALGTDTIGSIRIPAAYCGVIGHMPRRGDIPQRWRHRAFVYAGSCRGAGHDDGAVPPRRPDRRRADHRPTSGARSLSIAVPDRTVTIDADVAAP